MGCCEFTTYFAAAVGRLVRQHVVIDLRHRWLPGDESAAVIHLTGRQVQGCIHGCRKRENTRLTQTFSQSFSNRLGSYFKPGKFFLCCNSSGLLLFFFFFLVSWQQRGKASVVPPGSLELQLEGVTGQGQLDWLLSLKMAQRCLFLAHQVMRWHADVSCDNRYVIN